MPIQTGQIIDGRYRIMREIGHGSMGAVYEGENIMVHRRVAIKVLHPEVAAKGTTVQRFEREAQAAGRIGSDHIVDVLDLGSLRDGSYYMVMEFLEGMTFTKRIISRGRLPPREVAPIVQQLLTGLEAAHKAGIIHRDLKPDNVFLQQTRSGQVDFVKILDFGVSKFNPLNTEEHLQLTRAGAVVGTPFYMSPEQAKGNREVDARSDLYSVGVIMFQAVTGQVPFHAGTFNELIFKIVLEQPPPPEYFVPDLDAGFSRIIRRGMAREPSERYQSATEMRDALSAWLHSTPEPPGNLAAAGPLAPPPSVGGRVTPPLPPSRAAARPAGMDEVDDQAKTRIISSPPPGPGALPPTQALPAMAPPVAERPAPPHRPPSRPARRPPITVPINVAPTAQPAAAPQAPGSAPMMALAPPAPGSAPMMAPPAAASSPAIAQPAPTAPMPAMGGVESPATANELTPPRGVPRPTFGWGLSRRTNITIIGMSVAALAVTAIGITVVVLASSGGSSTPEASTTTAAETTSPTATSSETVTAPAPTSAPTAEASAEQTAAATAAPAEQPPEPVAEPQTPRPASGSKTKASEPTTAAAATAEPPPASAPPATGEPAGASTATGKPKGKGGRQINTEL